MTEQRNLFINHLKGLSATELEKALAVAIRELTGYGYNCKIRKIDFELGQNRFGANVELTFIRNANKDKSKDKKEENKKD